MLQEGAQATAQQILAMTEQLIRFLYEELQKKTNIKEEQERLMKKFVQGKGPVVGSAVPPKRAEALREELVKQGIPFMEVPGQQNGTLFLVRKEHEQKFLDIQTALAAKDTALAKELTFEDGLRALKSLGIKNVPTVTIKDAEMAQIAKQKLFQSGQTFISNTDKNGNTHIILFPSAIYNENGKDLEAFKLAHALTQARGDGQFSPLSENGEPQLMELRKRQAAYDETQIRSFIKDAKAGRHVVLGDVRGNGSIYIEAKNGQITVRDKNGDDVEIDYNSDDSIPVIEATLSRYTENIYNMCVVEGDFYNDNMRDNYIRKTDLPKHIQENMRPDINDKDADGNLIYSKETIEGNRCITGAAQHMINQINEEATKRCKLTNGYSVMTNEQKAAAKHREIITILNDPKFPAIKEFLSEGKPGFDNDMRKALFDAIRENFTNEEQKTRYSADIDNEKVSDLSIPDYSEEAEYDHDREEF